jgi:hypothetical protein
MKHFYKCLVVNYLPQGTVSLQAVSHLTVSITGLTVSTALAVSAVGAVSLLPQDTIIAANAKVKIVVFI